MSEVVTTPPWVRPPGRWILPPASGPEVVQLSESLGLSRLAAAVLHTRGYSDLASAREFLSPTTLHDPMALRDMDKAIARLQSAIRKREPILIYGDYDVDGTASIVVLKKAIEVLGGVAEFHIPHRLNEGYGMRTEVIENAAKSGIGLVISVDTGIRALEVVRHANSVGIDVIVTDHHLPEAELPRALAVLNPNRTDCQYPFKHLCGAGVTFKLVQALLKASDIDEKRQSALLESFLKPVAIATVADIVPLVGENRTIVHRGLSGLKRVRNLGLQSLLRVAGFDEGEVPSAHQVAFRLAPRINAAGRMSTARDVVELFLTKDPERAQILAKQLDALNRERQQVESEIVEAIVKRCQETVGSLDSRALVFDGEDWHLGVLGIVASRLVERYCRPVFVLSNTPKSEDGESYLTGSGRSIPAFHLLQALESMSDLFTKFGGHKQAAGLTLPYDQLPDFRERFGEFASRTLSSEDLCPEYKVDAAASLSEVQDRSVQDVLALGPFGFGNALPLFFTESVEVAAPPKTLGDGKHLTIPFRQGGRIIFVKAWNFGTRSELFKVGNQLDILFQVEDDPHSRKRGFGSWCISLKDARPSSARDR